MLTCLDVKIVFLGGLGPNLEGKQVFLDLCQKKTCEKVGGTGNRACGLNFGSRWRKKIPWSLGSGTECDPKGPVVIWDKKNFDFWSIRPFGDFVEGAGS